MSLLERLALPADAKALIVSCDNLGTSHAANAAVYDALRRGGASTAGLVVPAPWARDAAAQFRGEDIGVRITLTSEYPNMTWSPITNAPSLLGGEGGFPHAVEDLWAHADLDEVEREARAQLERAIYWGFDVTHLDSHHSVLGLRPEFFAILIELAQEYQLPLRLASVDQERNVGFPFRQLAAQEGVLSPDRVERIIADSSSELLAHLENAEDGVTELAFHPALDSPERQALSEDWAGDVTHDELLHNPFVITALQKVTVIGYRELRTAQRTT